MKAIKDLVEGLNNQEIMPIKNEEDKSNEVTKKVEQYLINMSEVEKEIKDLEKKKATIREILLKAMEENSVKKLETPYVVVTYIAPSKRTTIDGKILKENFKEVYNQVVKISDVKSSIKVNIKK